MPMSHGLIKKAPQPFSYTSTSLFCKLPSLNLQTVQPSPSPFLGNSSNSAREDAHYAIASPSQSPPHLLVVLLEILYQPYWKK